MHVCLSHWWALNIGDAFIQINYFNAKKKGWGKEINKHEGRKEEEKERREEEETKEERKTSLKRP